MKNFLLICFSAVVLTLGARDEFSRNRLHYSTEKGFNGKVAGAVFDGNNLRVYYEYKETYGDSEILRWSSVVSTDNGATWKDQPDLIKESGASIKRGGIIPISNISGVTAKFLAIASTTKASGGPVVIKGYYTDGVTTMTSGIELTGVPSSAIGADVFTYKGTIYLAVLTPSCATAEIYPLKLEAKKITVQATSAGSIQLVNSSKCSSLQIKEWGSKLLLTISTGVKDAKLGSSRALQLKFDVSTFKKDGEFIPFIGGADANDFKLFNNKAGDLYTIGWNGNEDYPSQNPTSSWKNGFTLVRKLDTTMLNGSIGQTQQLAKPLNSGTLISKDVSLTSDCTKSIDLSKLSNKDKVGGLALTFDFDGLKASANKGFTLNFKTANDKENLIIKLETTDSSQWNYVIDATKTKTPQNKLEEIFYNLDASIEPKMSLTIILDHSVVEGFVAGNHPISFVKSVFLTDKNPYTKVCIGKVGGGSLKLKATSKYSSYANIWGTGTSSPAYSLTGNAILLVLGALFIFVGI